MAEFRKRCLLSRSLYNNLLKEVREAGVLPEPAGKVQEVPYGENKLKFSSCMDGCVVELINHHELCEQGINIANMSGTKK
jgi:hypothetical protein